MILLGDPVIEAVMQVSREQYADLTAQAESAGVDVSEMILRSVEGKLARKLRDYVRDELRATA